MARIIEDNIPLPDVRHHHNSKYDFHLIGLNQSCFYAGDETAIKRIRVALNDWAMRRGFNFTTRQQTCDGIQGVRVWRRS